MIARSHPALSVGAQCRLLSISRSSFYYASQGDTELNLALMPLIDRQPPAVVYCNKIETDQQGQRVA